MDVPASGSTLETIEQPTISAFVVSVEGRWWLVTAGHVLVAMKRRFAEGNRRLKRAHLFNLLNGDTVPYDLDLKRTFSFDDDAGGDIGLLPIGPLMANTLRAGGIVPLAEDRWDRQPSSTEERWLVGLPASLKEPLRIAAHGSKVTIGSAQSLIMLPMREVETVPECLQANPERRILGRVPQGRIEPMGRVVDDIDGLSGSPIFDTTRESAKEVSYTLVAVQSSWHAPSRVASGTRLRPVLLEIARACRGKDAQDARCEPQIG